MTSARDLIANGAKHGGTTARDPDEWLEGRKRTLGWSSGVAPSKYGWKEEVDRELTSLGLPAEDREASREAA